MSLESLTLFHALLGSSLELCGGECRRGMQTGWGLWMQPSFLLSPSQSLVRRAPGDWQGWVPLRVSSFSL